MASKAKEEPVVTAQPEPLIGASKATSEPGRRVGKGPGRPKKIADEDRARMELAELRRIETLGGTILPDDGALVDVGDVFDALKDLKEDSPGVKLPKSDSQLRKIAQATVQQPFVQKRADGHTIVMASSATNWATVMRKEELDASRLSHSRAIAALPPKPGKLPRGRPKKP